MQSVPQERLGLKIDYIFSTYKSFAPYAIKEIYRVVIRQ